MMADMVLTDVTEMYVSRGPMLGCTGTNEVLTQRCGGGQVKVAQNPAQREQYLHGKLSAHWTANGIMAKCAQMIPGGDGKEVIVG
jgi:hypothetical protein